MTLSAGRPNPSAPSVAPITDGAPRPFWSVMIPTHDCADYLRRTLASVLEQAPGPAEMQIEVVDDCSTRDDTERVVRVVGKGRVGFHRQPRNVGAVPNFNTCIARARGEWLHILHSDDLVRPGFYAALRAGIAQQPEVGAAFCRCSVIDERDRETELYELERDDAGVLDGFVSRLAVWSRIQTPTIVVRRSVYEQLGGFDIRLVHAADWEMWQRVASHHSIWYEPRPLAQYRMHAASDTSRLVRTAANVVDTRRAIEIANGYLPRPIAADLRRQALAFYGESAMWQGWRLRAAGDTDGALAQLGAAVGCFRDAGQRRRALRLWAAAMRVRVGRRVGLERAPAAAGG
jgi:glycosyltransferase involved in cell wall biosynthesis